MIEPEAAGSVSTADPQAAAQTEKQDYKISTTDSLLNLSSPKDNNNSIQYESINVVSDDGDSIYSPPLEELFQDGQIYVSKDKIRNIVNEELDRRLGPSLNNKNE